MKKTRVAFDVDGTLLNYDDTPRLDVIQLLLMFMKMPSVEVIVWSGSGKEYAFQRVRQLGLDNLKGENMPRVASKTEAPELQVDLCFDDMEDVKLGLVNIRI